MKNELLRSYAALALDSILTNDDITYSRLNRSALCFRIQEEHTEIEKEISFALEIAHENLSITVSSASRI